MPIVPLNAPLDTADQRQDPLRYMESRFRILAALIDAVVLDFEWQEWRVLGHVQTAISKEKPPLEREDWNFDKARGLMNQRGWATVADACIESGMSDRQRHAYLLSVEGKSDRDIADAMGVPPITARVWLHRARERLRRLDNGELGVTEVR